MMSEEISNADAITIVSGQLPEEGMTLREFIRRAVIARGDTGDEIERSVEEVLALAEADGISPDDLIKMGPTGTKLN